MNAVRYEIGFAVAAVMIAVGLWIAPDSWTEAPITREQGIVGIFWIAFVVVRIEYHLDRLYKQARTPQ